MTRPNQDISVGGGGSKYWSDTEETTVWVTNSLRYQETVVGVARHKPTGWLTPTPYSLKIVNTRYPYGDLRWGQLANYWNHTSGWLRGTDVCAPSYDSVCTEALMGTVSASTLSRALLTARAEMKRSKVNLGIAFGERKKTASLVGDTAKRIGLSVRALRRGQIRRAMDHLGISSRRGQPRGGNVPQKWLELQYGWKPLLNDVYGAIHALAEKPKYEWRITSFGKAQSAPVDLYDEVLPYPVANFGAGWTRAKSSFKGVRTRLDAIPDNELLSSLTSLGVTNPLLVGWELVPFSFVFDWFVPVGLWLDSIDALNGYTGVTESTSVLVKAKWTKGGLSETYSSVSYNLNDYTASKTMFKLDRFIGSGSMPTWPGFKDPRSYGHLANGLSLLAGAFGKEWPYRWRSLR